MPEQTKRTNEGYYEGIFAEEGKRVRLEDAFGYAMERITSNPEDMKDFKKEFPKMPEIEEIRETITDWFYSGNWIRR